MLQWILENAGNGIVLTVLGMMVGGILAVLRRDRKGAAAAAAVPAAPWRAPAGNGMADGNAPWERRFRKRKY